MNSLMLIRRSALAEVALETASLGRAIRLPYATLTKDAGGL